MKWEYLVHRRNALNESLQDTLAKYGADGWELVTVVPEPPFTNLVFKRPAK